MAGSFVGRVGELAAVLDLTKGVMRGGGPAVALVLGDPGSGKSRLLTEACSKITFSERILLAGYEPEATAGVVAADLVGAAMMVPKTYQDPASETLATFAFASIGGALAAGAVGALDPSLLLYPVYYCLVNGAIALLILHRRGVLADRPGNVARASSLGMEEEYAVR